MRVLADLLRLIVLLLLLPVALILIGPLLVLAALRGRQQMGPITLDTSRSPARRAGAWIVGLLIWLLVWGGLAWLAVAALTPPPTVAQMPVVVTATPSANQEASPTPPPLSPTAARPQSSNAPAGRSTSATLVSTTSAPALTKTIMPTGTTVPVTATLITTIATTASATVPVAIAAETPTPEPTSPNTSTTIPAFTPTPTATATAPPRPTVTPTPTIPGAIYLAVIAAVETGNGLLHDAITEATEDNLQKMETVWQDKALMIARAFAANINSRYAKPLNVESEYLIPPRLDGQLPDDRLVVTSFERWTYGGSTKTGHQEAFKFTYTLTRRNGQWVITEYSFFSLSPTPIPTRTPTVLPTRTSASDG